MGEKEPRFTSLNAEEDKMVPETERQYLIQQLSEMYESDQQAREKWKNTGTFDPRIDQENAQKLEAIIQKYGWPTKSNVGEEGMYAAWTVAQHLPEDSQERHLPLLEKATKENELELSLFAFFVDRVAARKFGKQLFGSQYLVRRLSEGKAVTESYPLASENERSQIAADLLSEGWEELLPKLQEAYEQSKENKA